MVLLPNDTGQITLKDELYARKMEGTALCTDLVHDQGMASFQRKYTMGNICRISTIICSLILYVVPHKFRCAGQMP